MRYTMNGPVYGAGAFLPQLPPTPCASSGGLVDVFGQPGTMAVRAPKPGALPETAAGWRLNQPSYCSPDVIYPDKYIPGTRNMHPPVPVVSDNELPVPAVNPRNLAKPSMRGRRIGTRTQIPQPSAPQVWPAWKGTGRLG